MGAGPWSGKRPAGREAAPGSPPGGPTDGPLLDRRADPGWGPVFAGLGWFVPGLQQRRMRRLRERGGFDGLLQLRSLLLAFVDAVVLIGVVVAFGLADTGAGPDPRIRPAAAIVVAVGAAGVAVAARLERPLDCSGDGALAGSYRSEFFLRVAAAEVPALAGFVAVMVVGPAWLYFLGAPFSLAGFALAAPSARNLARAQDRLRLQGCARSLVAALRDPHD